MILKIMYAPLLCQISCFLHNAVKFQGVGGDYGGGVVWEAGSNHTLIELYKLSSFFCIFPAACDLGRLPFRVSALSNI